MYDSRNELHLDGRNGKDQLNERLEHEKYMIQTLLYCLGSTKGTATWYYSVSSP
jgi:hypothetical protein